MFILSTNFLEYRNKRVISYEIILLLFNQNPTGSISADGLFITPSLSLGRKRKCHPIFAHLDIAVVNIAHPFQIPSF